MKNIDRCFVNGDADGITEIMKNTEANTELPGMHKLMIINECKSAMFELRIDDYGKDI